MGPNSRGCSLLGRGEELESAQAMQCCKCVGLQRRWAEVVLADWEPLRQQISPSLYSWSLKSRQLQLCSNKFVTRSHCCSLSIILLAHWQQDKNSPASFPRQRQPGPSQNWDWSTCAAARMQFLSKNVVCYGTALIFLSMMSSYPPRSTTTLPQYSAKAISDQHSSLHWHLESTSPQKLLRDKPSHVQSILLYSYADVSTATFFNSTK